MTTAAPRARILCIAPSWLGDAVLARRAVALLGRAVAVDVWARGSLGRVFEDLPGIAMVAAPQAERPARFRAAWRLRARRYAGALVLAPSFSTAFAARLSGAPIRVGRRGDGRRWLLTHALPDPGRDVHLAAAHVELAASLLAALALTRATEAAEAPPLVARSDEIEAARALLAARALGTRPFLVVAPGARFGPAKQYPAERFAAAAARVAGPRDWDVVLVGEASDAPATAAVAAALPGAHDLAGRTSLPALFGLLARAAGVLANDSGTMHVAAALGVPVVGIFGSTNPRWTAPVGARAAFLVHPVFCAPCYAPTCVQDFGCMLGIAPEAVAAALAERLDADRPRAGARA